MELTYKQTEALDLLEDNQTKEIVFGGGAGSAKSFLGCYWLLKMCIKYPGTRWLMGRKKLKTLKETTYTTSFLEVCKKMDIKPNKHFNYNQLTNTITFYNGSEILMKDLAYYPADPNFDELGSLEITGAFIDECNQVVELAWQIVKSRIRYKLDENNLIPKILGTCNPSKNWVYQKFYKPSKDNKLEKTKVFIQALVTDNPYISEHYVENLKTMGKAQRDRLLHGIWEQNDDNALIEYDNILNVFTNTHVVDENGKGYITCDVARLGSDKAVIAVWRGFEVTEIYTYPISKINELQGVIIALKNKHNIGNSNIIIDEDGVGGGLVDFLPGSKGFVNNSRALNEENFQNLKTQCYYKLAEAVNKNQIYISAEVDTEEQKSIIEELEQVKTTDTDSDGKLKILSKQDVKHAIGRSPDYSDALAMRMYAEVGPVRSDVSLRF